MKLFAPLDVNKSSFLPVSVEDQVYWEESGNPQGEPILFLHGGPGGGTEPKHRQYYCPQKWRIIMLDQRGCGKSKPTGKLEGNKTQNLIKDIEKLRKKLKIDRWTVTGSSWGTTLALAYTIAKPEVVKELFLRSVFLARPQDINDSVMPSGLAAKLYPEEFKKLTDALEVASDSPKVLQESAHILKDSSHSKFEQVALAWVAWEFVLYSHHWSAEKKQKFKDAPMSDDLKAYLVNTAKLELHYFSNNCFFESDNYILDNINKIKDIPLNIIHGDQDLCTPLEQAKALASAHSNANLTIVKGAGHGASAEPMKSAVVKFLNS